MSDDSKPLPIIYCAIDTTDLDHAKALAAAVAASGSLAELNLGSNPTIGDEGSNRIGDEGAKALAAGIFASGSLTVLG